MVYWLVIIFTEWPFLFWIDRFWRVRKSTSLASKESFIIYLKFVEKFYDVLKSLTGCLQMILYHLISSKFTRNNFPGSSFPWWGTFPEISLPGWKANLRTSRNLWHQFSTFKRPAASLVFSMKLYFLELILAWSCFFEFLFKMWLLSCKIFKKRL